jgi:predicted transposase YdaD
MTAENEIQETDAAANEYENENVSPEHTRFDHDSFWKDLIERFFYYLLKRAIPELYDAANTTISPRFLDKEFRDILNTADPEIHTSPHFADFVMETPLKDGSDAWVLLHIEAQGRGGGNLAERMNIYKSLIVAHYRREPVALAIITEGRREDERRYSHSHYGTKAVYEYNNLVLAELGDKELLASDNPIDLALYAAKGALKVREERQKYNYLRALLELLAERGWSRDDKRDLLLFLERVVNLRDKNLEIKYTEYRNHINREGKVMYIPLGERDLAREIERRGREEGMSIGMEKARVEMARNLLANGVSPDLIARSAGLPLEHIRKLMN